MKILRASSPERKTHLRRHALDALLPYQAPLDWAGLIAFYRAHQITGVEKITDVSYSRVFRLGGRIGWVLVTNEEDSSCKVQISSTDPEVRTMVTEKIRYMFDLDLDPRKIAKAFRSQEHLGSVWRKYPGMRLLKGWDPFEIAIGTILGQVVSVSRAKALVEQLVNQYGEKISHPDTDENSHFFPRPEVLAEAALDDLGTTQVRKKTIRALSLAILQGSVDLAAADGMQAFKDSLLSLPGIGPWSAEYIALRGLGDTDAFPANDLALKRAIQEHPQIDLDAVRPWRSYAAVCFWKSYTGNLLNK